MKIFDELKWRGLIQDISSPELEEKLNNGGMTFFTKILSPIFKIFSVFSF